MLRCFEVAKPTFSRTRTWLDADLQPGCVLAAVDSAIGVGTKKIGAETGVIANPREPQTSQVWLTSHSNLDQ